MFIIRLICFKVQIEVHHQTRTAKQNWPLQHYIGTKTNSFLVVVMNTKGSMWFLSILWRRHRFRDTTWITDCVLFTMEGLKEGCVGVLPGRKWHDMQGSTYACTVFILLLNSIFYTFWQTHNSNWLFLCESYVIYSWICLSLSWSWVIAC